VKVTRNQVAVLLQRVGDRRLPDSVKVIDAPVKLREDRLGGLAISLVFV
jgi:hypothetical protein